MEEKIMGWFVIEILPPNEDDGYFELRNIENEFIDMSAKEFLLKFEPEVTLEQQFHKTFGSYCKDVEYELHFHLDYPFRIIGSLTGQTNQFLDWLFSYLPLDPKNKPELLTLFSLLEEPHKDMDEAITKISESVQKLTRINLEEDRAKYHLMASAFYEIQANFSEED
jgi:hypothetical protein